jgi:hypothetical protein
VKALFKPSTEKKKETIKKNIGVEPISDTCLTR